MRIFTPFLEIDSLKTGEMNKLLAANFHSAGEDLIIGCADWRICGSVIRVNQLISARDRGKN